MSPTLHIIGAGLAGLSAALHASKRGIRTIIYESTPHAGGRCRSFADKKLGLTIDNGNHLILGANNHVLDFLKELGTLETCLTRLPAGYRFVNLTDRSSWHAAPPYKFPGIPWYDWLQLFKLYKPASYKTVTQCISPKSTLYRRLIEPLTLAGLNTHPSEASAAMLWEVLRLLIKGGEPAWRYYLPEHNLSASLVLPAVSRIRQNGGTFYFSNPVQHIEYDQERVTSLGFNSGSQPVRECDAIICATPAYAMGNILPELAIDFTYSSILNAHFAWEYSGILRENLPFIGVLGGLAEWIFLHEGRISTTTSAADKSINEKEEILAVRLWHDVQQALYMPKTGMPNYRIIKEKRATIAVTPENLARRPLCETHLINLWLAGDYIQSPYPATLEAAIATGSQAAEKALDFML